MTDPITGVGGNYISAKKVDQKGDEINPEVRDSITPGLSTDGAVNGDVDSVQLSNEVAIELEQAGFDEAKVAQIKQALADGNYPIDPRRIAEGFTEFEKLL